MIGQKSQTTNSTCDTSRHFFSATNVEEDHASQISNRAEMVNATVKLTNEKIEEDVNQIGKTVPEKRKTTTTNKLEHKITHRHKRGGKRKIKHSSYDQDLKELEHLLEKALETFKCDDSTEETSVNNFVTYPVTDHSNTKSIIDFDNSITDGCDKDGNSTNTDGKKFSNDLDDLVTVIVGVMDEPQAVTKSHQIWPSSPLTVPTEAKVQKKSEWFPTKWIMVPFRDDYSPSNPSVPSYLTNSKENRLGSDDICHKCGRRHLGGNFCPHCGSSVHHHHSHSSFCPLCKKLDN